MSEPLARVETADEIGTDDPALVRRWLTELALEEKEFKDWRQRGQKVVDRYRDEERTGARARTSQMNILWSNTETVKPALFGAMPEPDVRRRFRDRDELGRVSAMALERSLAFALDAEAFDVEMEHVVQDYQLPGRGVMKVDYEPRFEGEEMKWEAAPAQYWDWRKFRMAPSTSWSKCRWICWDHEMTREDLVENFKEVGKKVKLDAAPEMVRNQLGEESNQEQFFQTVKVHEIWDKTSREVLFISPGYRDGPLKRTPDPLQLTGFFNTPEPLDIVRTNGTMVPIPEFTLYQDQADELDRITGRIDAVVDAIRVRGVYNATMEAVGRLLDSAENQLIPEDKWNEFQDKGGLEANLAWMPIDRMASVLVVLYQQRGQILDVIYQITGISDVMRGASDSDETAAAQRLKGQFGTFRLQPKQRAVQRYVRDVLRLKAEIMAQRFSPETLAQMSGIRLPSEAEKQLAEFAIQGAQLAGQQPPPDAVEALEKPTWKEVKAVLEDDAQRSFRIDIETDSTVAPDATAEKQAVTEYLTASGGYMQTMAPLVEMGIVPPDLARTILLWASRKFKVSREIEDELEGNQDGAAPMAPPQQPETSPEEMKARQDAEMAAAKMQADQAKEAAGREFEREKHASDQQFALQTMKTEMAFKASQAELDRQTNMEIERRRLLAKMEPEIAVDLAKTEDMPERGGIMAALQGLAEQSAQMNAQANENTAGLAQSVAEMTAALTEMTRAFNAPKRLVRDENGRPVGVETVE